MHEKQPKQNHILLLCSECGKSYKLLRINKHLLYKSEDMSTFNLVGGWKKHHCKLYFFESRRNYNITKKIKRPKYCRDEDL